MSAPSAPRPLRQEDYDVLRWVTDEYLRARDVAAMIHGKTTQEVVDSGESAEIGRVLQRLRAWGYVDREYDYDTPGARCCYRLSEKGREWLLLAQAA